MAQRQGLRRRRECVGEHQQHITAREDSADLDHDCPPPLLRLRGRVEQQLLRQVGAARRQSDQRCTGEREGENTERERPCNAREPWDPIVSERCVDQAGGHEHGGLRGRVRDHLQYAARQGAAAVEPGRSGVVRERKHLTGPNLSEWALKHRSFVVFLMIAVTVAGLTSYSRLGRNEDPAFTFRTMIVQASWPGATLDDTLRQVTERLERTLQETKGLDFLRSYTSPGLTTIFVNLKGKTTAAEVPDIWYQVRKKVGDMRHTLPAGVIGPGFNDDFGDTFGLIYGFTAQGFTHRELRDYVEDIRSRLLHVADVSQIEIIGAQDEQIFVEFSTQQLAGLGIDRAALIAALQAQNAVSPAGSIQTGDEKLSLQVSGAFRSERDILAVNFLSNGRLIRLRDIADVRRSFADPPQPMFRVNGEPAIGLAIAMRNGGDILALGRNVKREIDEAMADLPLGIEPKLVSDQPAVVVQPLASS